jgi:hypothetical protein
MMKLADRINDYFANAVSVFAQVGELAARAAALTAAIVADTETRASMVRYLHSAARDWQAVFGDAKQACERLLDLAREIESRGFQLEDLRAQKIVLGSIDVQYLHALDGFDPTIFVHRHPEVFGRRGPPGGEFPDHRPHVRRDVAAAMPPETSDSAAAGLTSGHWNVGYAGRRSLEISRRAVAIAIRPLVRHGKWLVVPSLFLLGWGFFAARARWGIEEIGHWFEKPQYAAFYEVTVAPYSRLDEAPPSVVRGLVERTVDEVHRGFDEDGRAETRSERSTWLRAMLLPDKTWRDFNDDDCYVSLYKNTFCEDDQGGRWLVRLTRRKLGTARVRE